MENELLDHILHNKKQTVLIQINKKKRPLFNARFRENWKRKSKVGTSALETPKDTASLISRKDSSTIVMMWCEE